MSLALNRENFFWHKVHSLTGVIPVGFYMVQHLTLNSFSLGGPEKFNGVIGFFESLPKHLLLTLEIFAIWLPLIFHSIYGLFITNRSQPNYLTTKYRWSQNRMYTFQRWSGIVIFFFLIYHVVSTTGYKYFLDLTNSAQERGYASPAAAIEFAAWNAKLTSFGGLFFVVYMIGIAASAYHLAYGLWNFSIRWGITISEKAQHRIQRISAGVFVALVVLGWAALAGFVLPRKLHEADKIKDNGPAVTSVATPRTISR